MKILTGQNLDKGATIMRKEFQFTLLLAITLIFLVGCERRTRVDQFFGTSYELAKQSQIANPKAGVEDGPSVGLDGKIASKVIKRYEKSYDQKAAKTETYSIDIKGVSTE